MENFKKICQKFPEATKISFGDKMFAENHATKKDVFNWDYHLFSSTLPEGWEPKSNCPTGPVTGGGGRASDPQCCQVWSTKHSRI